MPRAQERQILSILSHFISSTQKKSALTESNLPVFRGQTQPPSVSVRMCRRALRVGWTLSESRPFQAARWLQTGWAHVARCGAPAAGPRAGLSEHFAEFSEVASPHADTCASPRPSEPGVAIAGAQKVRP